MREATTSGDIAFARGEVRTTPTEIERSLLKDKSRKMNKDTEKRLLRVKEAHDNKIPKLKIAIMRQIDGIIGNSPLGFERFHGEFGNLADISGTMNSAIHFDNIPDDIEKLEKSLPEDVGELELILSSLKSKRNVQAYEPFSSYKDLFVARMKTVLAGITLVYEGGIPFSYNATENLFVGDVDKAVEIEEEFKLRRLNQLLFPVGGVFDKSFFRNIKDIILTDKKETA